MKHLTENQIDEMRAALDAERTDLEEQLAEHGRSVGGDWQGTPKGFDGNEADVTDTADRMEELATNIPLVEELESRLREVRGALEKIEKGTYGICEKTGKEIPFDRLEVNPAARTVVEAA